MRAIRLPTGRLLIPVESAPRGFSPLVSLDTGCTRKSGPDHLAPLRPAEQGEPSWRRLRAQKPGAPQVVPQPPASSTSERLIRRAPSTRFRPTWRIGLASLRGSAILFPSPTAHACAALECWEDTDDGFGHEQGVPGSDQPLDVARMPREDAHVPDENHCWENDTQHACLLLAHGWRPRALIHGRARKEWEVGLPGCGTQPGFFLQQKTHGDQAIPVGLCPSGRSS